MHVLLFHQGPGMLRPTPQSVQHHPSFSLGVPTQGSRHPSHSASWARGLGCLPPWLDTCFMMGSLSLGARSTAHLSTYICQWVGFSLALGGLSSTMTSLQVCLPQAPQMRGRVGSQQHLFGASRPLSAWERCRPFIHPPLPLHKCPGEIVAYCIPPKGSFFPVITMHPFHPHDALGDR